MLLGQDPSIIISFPGSECSVGLTTQTWGARSLAFHRVSELGHCHLLKVRELGFSWLLGCRPTWPCPHIMGWEQGALPPAPVRWGTSRGNRHVDSFQQLLGVAKSSCLSLIIQSLSSWELSPSTATFRPSTHLQFHSIILTGTTDFEWEKNRWGCLSFLWNFFYQARNCVLWASCWVDNEWAFKYLWLLVREQAIEGVGPLLCFAMLGRQPEGPGQQRVWIPMTSPCPSVIKLSVTNLCQWTAGFCKVGSGRDTCSHGTNPGLRKWPGLAVLNSNHPEAIPCSGDLKLGLCRTPEFFGSCQMLLCQDKTYNELL